MENNTRSPRYPAVNLADAVGAVTKLWNKERRTPVGSDVLARAIGYKGNSGPARTLAASMRQYGLIEKSGTGMRLSDRGMKIVHGSTEDRIAAMKEAALAPELFSELHETHSEASEDAIKSFLILRKGFSESGAQNAASAYRQTLALAGMDGVGYDFTGDKEVPTATVSNQSENIAGGAARANGKPIDNLLLTQALMISIPRSMKVDISVRGDEIKKEDLAKIQSQFNRWIEGLVEAFE